MGTILLGAFFLAFGLFVSGLCQDQIVAFVITLLGCFGIFLLGTDFIATYIDSAWPGLGSFLAEVVGMTQALCDALHRDFWSLATCCIFLSGRPCFCFSMGSSSKSAAARPHAAPLSGLWS